MKKKWVILIFALLLLPALALGETKTKWTEAPELIRPGKSVRFAFDCPVSDACAVTLLDASESSLGEVWSGTSAEGANTFFWDGTLTGSAVAQGDYTLRISVRTKTIDTKLSVGESAPVISDVHADETFFAPWSMTVEVSMPGTLTLSVDTGDGAREALRQEVEQGENEVSWDGMVDGTPIPSGEWDLELRLYDSTDFSSAPTLFTITVPQPYTPALATDEEYHTPSEIPCDHDVCYWRLNMGEMDESAIWDVLTQSVTVLAGDQRQQAKVYAQPDKNSAAIAEVTYDSQAVHLLSVDGDWAFIEGYSSSMGEDSTVKNYANHFTGYVPASLLQEKQVSQKYGIVIDKLQQRLYVFKDGRLFSTLLCSTGFARSDTPQNETPAGEYLVVSRTGGFWSGSLFCDMALRINDGILLHEVPCTIAEDGVTRSYERCEQYLGEKASHGCIRIQRKPTPEGVSMQWLWDNLEVGTKVIIWNEIGRTLAYPDEDVTLWYNPNKGKNYHSAANCAGVKQELWSKMASFTYGELDDAPYKSLTPCPYCAPQLGHEGIDKLNDANVR